MRKIFWGALLLGLSGCGSSADKPTADKPNALPSLQRVAQNIDKKEADEAALRKGLETDLTPVVDLAKTRMREATAENWGDDVAKKATISADASGVKRFGSDKWQVSGRYKGTDSGGNSVDKPWTATIELMLGSLECTNVKLGSD